MGGFAKSLWLPRSRKRQAERSCSGRSFFARQAGCPRQELNLCTRFTQGQELPARLHTAGDEFVVLLPGVGEATASLRAREVEAALEQIDLPESHRAVYGGASVGFATRRAQETPEQALDRAIHAMYDRKLARRGQRGL